MTPQQISVVREVESVVLNLPQIDIETEHEFHAGIYSRTIMIPAGVVLTGALIKIPTVLILSGDATVMIGDSEVRLTGYGVLPAEAGRKQMFIAHQDTYLTMLFKTDVTTVFDAENEFTDEAENLGSRREK
jgi:hypothetical protein